MWKNKKQKGSITVFLSLILILISSFIFTSIEAARISGGQAYLSMLSSLAGESFLASYYYPLFEQYGLLGVDAGYQTSYLSEQQINNELQTEITYGVNQMQGGLLLMEQPEVQLQDYKTLLSQSGEGFLSQIKAQSIYEGMELTWSVLFDQMNLQDSTATSELYHAQEDLQEQAANTVTELLKLMTLIDGIATNEQGLKTDENGALIAETPFVKQMTSLSESDLSIAFGNDAIYQTVKGYFLYPEVSAKAAGDLFGTALSKESQLSELTLDIAECNSRISSIPSELKLVKKEKKEWEKKLKKAKEDQDSSESASKLITEAEAGILECDTQIAYLDKEMEYCEAQKEFYEKEKKLKESELEEILNQAKPIYTNLQQNMESVLTAVTDALVVVDELELKQAAAWTATAAYEVTLKGKEAELSSELYQVFSDELANLKLYLCMEEQGYSTEIMRRTLNADLFLLQELELPKFDENNVITMYLAMSDITHRISEYSLEGLWFSYGEVTAGSSTGKNVKATMGQLLATGVLELVGIERATLSEAELSGVELPSGGLQSSVSGDLLKNITKMQELLSDEGIFAVLQAGTTEVSEDILLELYLSRYFSNYLSEKEKTRLSYEREYILFGHDTDVENLCSLVLSLIAFRSVFTMTSLLLDSTRREAAGALATALVGFTGIPILIYALKYVILLLWSIEEAIVETAAILQGKKIPLYSRSGNVAIHELLLVTKSRIKAKADAITSSAIGAGYSEYLMLLSLLEGTKKKSYYAMDLIQENIRIRYRDSFRIRNVVISADFMSKASLTQKFNTNFFTIPQYQLETVTCVTYE